MTDQANNTIMHDSFEETSKEECIQAAVEDNKGGDTIENVEHEKAQETVNTTIQEARQEERTTANYIQHPSHEQCYCPKCGSRIREENAGAIVRYVCAGCGNDLGTGDRDAFSSLHSFYQYANAVMDGFRDKDGWNDQAVKRLDRNITDNLVSLVGNPFFQMLEIVRFTDGFRKMPQKRHERGNVNSYYKTVHAFYKKHKAEGEIENLTMLINRYKEMLKNTRREQAKRFAKICSFVLIPVIALFVAAFLTLHFYTPELSDTASGIKIHASNDTFDILSKFGLQMTAEEYPENSVSYIDAKNALRNETEKFVLFDLAIKQQNKVVDFESEITVEIPIPAGYQASCLKVYHIISDEQYEEIPSFVSTANNTISFKTTHFSFYAIAERHPIVTFDSDGAQEIDRQIVERDTKLSPPIEPTKTGYTFGGWIYDGRVWNFDTDTVKKDITLTAKWIPNKYTVTLIAEGGDLASNTVEVTFQGTYDVLPQTVDKPGYAFVGWFTALENGVKVENDAVVTLTENHTLYAHFEKNTNTLVFNSNGANGSMVDLKLPTAASAKLPKNTFTKKGYTFLGWSLTETGEVVFADQATYTMDTKAIQTLYAQWQINSGVLKFDGNGGEGTMSSLSMNYGTSQMLPANAFVRAGYSFVGWSIIPTGGVLYQDQAEYIMGEKSEYVLYAQWELNTNHLHFHANGGSGSMDHIEKKTGELTRLPTCTFTREGYRFDGWSLTENGPMAYADQAEYMMTTEKEVQLYARWVGIENAFTFHANGGKGAMRSDFTIPTGSKANLPNNQFERDGYKFMGWSTDPSGAVDYAECAEYEVKASGSVNLYAVWALVDYTISFTPNGGSSVADITYNIEDETFELSKPTRDGYIFDGWFKNELFTGAKVEQIDHGTYGNITLYAKWNVKEYEITFNPNGGESCGPIYYNIETPTFSLPLPTKTGYTFGGWHKESDLSDAVVTSVELGTFGNMEFYAEWVPVIYQIHFHPENGIDIDAITYTIESLDIQLPIPEKTGYQFAGWFNDSSFEGDPVMSVVNGSTGDKEFYAKWSLITYQIVFHPNNGSEIYPKDYTIESPDVQLPIPQKTGYQFAGWFTNSSFEGDHITSVVNGSTGDKEFYAKWSLINYQITFSPDNGSTLDPITYTIESLDVQLPIPEKAGYDFAGWFDNSSFEGNPINVVPFGSTGDKQFYAKWTLSTYQITFHPKNGSSIASITYTIQSSDIQLPIPKFAGYDFLGWFDNSALKGEPITSIASGSTGNKEFYAKWSGAKEYTITFETNGGTSIESIVYTILDSWISLPDFLTKHGYDFAGWYEKSNLSGSSIDRFSATICENVILYAKWTPKNYTVKYETNGGFVIDNGNYNIETAFNLEPTTKIGYTFDGWYDNPLFAGDSIFRIEAGSTGDRTFYAKWKKNTYTVIYHPNGGTGEMDDSEFTYDVAKPLSKNKFSKEYYNFGGWSSSKDGTILYEDRGQVKNLTEEENGIVTLYAIWIPKTYTVTFNTGGGDPMAPLTYSYNPDAPVTLPNATFKGYAFSGWHTNLECTGDPITQLPAGTTGDLTLYCKWTSAHFYLMLHCNGGTLEDTLIKGTLDPREPDATRIHLDNLVLPTPTWPTYANHNHFVGWYVDEACTIPFNEVKESLYEDLRDLDLYAKWDLMGSAGIYKTVGEIPTAVDGGRIVIDLSDVSGNTPCNTTVTFTGAGEVILIGTSNVLYTNLVVDIATEEEVKIVLINFNMVGNIRGWDSNAIIECEGTSSVVAPYAERAAIAGFKTLTIGGNGTLTVKGANGVSASQDGSVGINADKLYLQDTLSITVYGGAGSSNGINGSNGISKELPAGVGSKGGNGGSAIVCRRLYVTENVTLKAQGGRGGNGAMGGKGHIGDPGTPGKSAKENGADWLHPNRDATPGGPGGIGGTGGTGGAGGHGGNAISSLNYFENKSEHVTLIGGDGGTGGTGGTGGQGGTGGRGGSDDYGGVGGNAPGKGGQGGQAGTGGTGGMGGNKGDAYTTTAELEGVAFYATNGKLGAGGTGGAAGERGWGGTGGSGGANGSNGATGGRGEYGSDGAAGKPYPGY